jgi:hypothetical protein
MTSYWLDQLRRTVWKGYTFSFLFYGRQHTKSLGKRPRFSKTPSNTSAFTCPRDNESLALRKQAVCSIPAPKTSQQITEFWGAAGFCQIWISNYSLLAKPLYEATKVGE